MEKDGGGLVTGNGLGNQCQNRNHPFQAIVPTTFVQSKILKAYPTSSFVLPFSWDCILSIYNELVKLVDRIPFQKHLVVTIVCRGSKFRIDLGEVRAAGVVCLIGLGLSLGTLLLYKLYLRIIIPFLRSLRAGKGNNPWLDDEYTLYLDDSESEVDSMGNSGSKRPPLPNVYYSRRNSGITLGSPRPTSPTSSSPSTSPTSPHNSSKSGLVHVPYVPAASSRASSVASGESATSSSLAVKPPDNVRLRPRQATSSSSSSTSARHKSPSPGSDKDSAIGGAGGSEMSQSMYSENSINNRDSFYSTGTIESGFDDLGGYLEELRSSKKLTGSLKENFSPNSLRERSLQMLYRAHRGGRDQGLNAIAGNGSGSGLDALSDCDSTHSGILSSCSTRSSCCSSDGTYVTRTNIDPLEQKMAAGQGHQRPHHHHHHRQHHHISGGDKPGIGFSTPNGDKSARNSISNSNNNHNSYNRQFSNSSSGDSKSSPHRPSSSCTAVGGAVSDRLHCVDGSSSTSTSNSMGGGNNKSSDHGRLRCMNNTNSSFEDEWRCGSSEQLSSSSPYRTSTGTTPHHHHHHGNNPSVYSDEELDGPLLYDNTASINSLDTSEDYGDINWQDGGREQEVEMVDRVREGEVVEEEDGDDDNGRRLSALPEHLNQSLSDLHFRQSLMQRIQEWSSFAEEYNKSMSPTPECSPIRFVRRSRSLDRHLSDSSVIASELEIPSSRPLEIEPVTEKHLETLEYELHDIQGEFESITSRLHDLIEQQEQATPSVTPSPLSMAPMSSSYPAAFTTKHSTPQSSSLLSSSSNNNNNNNNNHSHHRNRQLPHPNPASDNNNIRQTMPMQSHHPHHHEISSSSCSPSPKRRFESKSTPCINKSSSSSSLRKMKTKWERVPGSACSDCSRSSRGSSVEYVWDMADYSTANSTIGPASADRSRSSPATGRRVSVSRNSRGMASTDLCPTDASDCVCNINQPVAILDYCQQEWKGDTPKAAAIRQGYHQIPSVFGCQRMCVIRGDNYCALRSTLFQVLVAGVRIVPSSWGIIGIMDRLHDHFDDPTIRMSAWNFANRLPGHTKDKLASISKCALSLYATVEEVCNLPTREEREKRTINLFNASSTFDLELMEGVKVMMLLQLVSLRQRILDGEGVGGGGDEDGGVPMFGHLLFARDSSETVADFIQNHLNRVGDSGGLEQVEMCLLGYTLGVSIKVLRLSQTGQEDSQCCFPDDMPAHTPQVVLMAEDDRHYNVPLP